MDILKQEVSRLETQYLELKSEVENPETGEKVSDLRLRQQRMQEIAGLISMHRMTLATEKVILELEKRKENDLDENAL